METRQYTHSRQGGLSLTEIVIVVAIIGVFAAAATVRFTGSLSHARLQHAAETLRGDLSLVRDRARQDLQSYALVIDAANCRYQAVGVRSIDGRVEIAADLRRAPYHISSISCNMSGDTFVQFDAEGLPARPGNIVLKSGSMLARVKIGRGGDIEIE